MCVSGRADSGYDRGHLAASANHDERAVQNSETVLLSNMSPQKPELNRGMWWKLELAIRGLNDEDDVLETYVLTAPIFYFDRKVEMIGDKHDEYGINVPISHAFVKSVLAEDRKGRLRLWTFEMENKALEGNVTDYLVITYDVEQKVGGHLWDRVAGADLHEQKSVVGTMWTTKADARRI